MTHTVTISGEGRKSVVTCTTCNVTVQALSRKDAEHIRDKHIETMKEKEKGV